MGRLDTHCTQSGEIKVIKVEYAAKDSSGPPVPLIYPVESIRERVFGVSSPASFGWFVEKETTES